MKKKADQIAGKEILRKQLELLAEESKNCGPEFLPQITAAMCKVYSLIE